MNPTVTPEPAVDRAAAAPAESIPAETIPTETAPPETAPPAGLDDRGDVPGWVLITLMTAGLVVIIWGLAGPALSGLFQQAIDRVSGL